MKTIKKEEVKMPELHQWFLLKYQNEVCLTGYIYNDPRADGKAYVDGHRIITPTLLEIDQTNLIATTRNTTYKLVDRKTEETIESTKTWMEILPKIT